MKELMRKDENHHVYQDTLGCEVQQKEFLSSSTFPEVWPGKHKPLGCAPLCSLPSEKSRRLKGYGNSALFYERTLMHWWLNGRKFQRKDLPLQSGSQSVVPRSAVSENLLGMQSPGPHPRPTDSDIAGGVQQTVF